MPMLPLSGERLLAACEQAHGESAMLRAITLLAAVLPECGREQVLQWPIAQRNRLLLQLHRISFGPSLDGYAACTQCGTGMELHLAVADVLDDIDESRVPTGLEWLEADQPRSMRQATSADLLAAAQAPSEAIAEERLLLRCMGMDESSAPTLPADAMQAARVRFEQLHAASQLHCVMHCPECDHEAAWELDPVHFVWREARRAAGRLLNDVHMLALNYGWSEADIVSMNPRRRETYLELLEA
ncbi:hypothetical protein ISN76_10400 [Dyella halodurans]|uniref:Phage baseplate protein n=1 Tax=Dyella halodurans TaxID=1920171 RepID=A0ABV9C3L6_9GAMM|nr:hypothetical protein [Dyella halodurans]